MVCRQGSIFVRVKMILKTNIRFLFFTAIAMLLLAGCLKKITYPTTPVIKFGTFTRYVNAQGADSAANIAITYTDGEGDIGLTQGDTIAPYVGTFYYNCFLEYYEKQNGIWVKPPINPPFYYRIPPLINGDGQAIEGTIGIRLSAPFFSPSAFDTIKFSIKIADRALHESNVVETPEIVVVK